MCPASDATTPLVRSSKSRTFKKPGFYYWGLLSLIVLLTALAGCSEKPPVQVVTQPEVRKHVAKEQPRAHFVMCIDNSRSITPREQILIRETTMLLADLAEEGDSISVIAFGRGAEVVARSQIRTNSDRIAFKNQVLQSVNFQENFSDIRAGLKTLAEQGESLLPRDGTISAVILLSDGKLEPADRKTQQAFDELKQILIGPLAQTNLYSVVLGNTTCFDRILPDLDGVKLMRDHVAKGSAEHFYHAQRMDQLLDIGVLILNKTKGITSLGEKDKSRFTIDKSVESLSLIVRKKSSDGAFLCNSQDILLNPPEAKRGEQAQAITAANHVGAPAMEGTGTSIYWSSDYQYFDLILVRKPMPGKWSVALTGGGRPEVLSKVVTPLELRFDVRETVFVNESDTISAWIFNKKTSEIISNQPFKIQAHISADGDLDKSKLYAVFHPDPGSGQYFLEVPAEIDKLLNLDGKPARVTMELIALERIGPDSEELDPWFARRSAPVTLELAEPFINWVVQEPQTYKLPFIRKALFFGGDLDPGNRHAPQFQGLPRLSQKLELYDVKSQSYKPVMENILEGTTEKDRNAYRAEKAVDSLGAGTYRYRYQLSGVKQDGGPYSIRSPFYQFQVRSFSWDSWEPYLVLAFLAFMALVVISSMTARLKGQIRRVGLRWDEVFRKTYSTDWFQLRAARFCFVKSSIILTAIRGVLTVDNQTTMSAGQKQKIAVGQNHRITCKDGERQAIAAEYELNLNV